MATVGAVNHLSVQSRVLSRVVVTHACPLPGIFFSIGEENVVALNVRTSVKLVCVVGLCLNFLSENAFAVIRPERQ